MTTVLRTLLNFERLNKSSIINMVVAMSKSSENTSEPDIEIIYDGMETVARKT